MAVAWAVGLIALFAVLAALFLGSGLEHADQLASVLALFVAILAVFLGQRRLRKPSSLRQRTAWGEQRLRPEIGDLLRATAGLADQARGDDRYVPASATYVRQRLETPHAEPAPGPRRDDHEPFLPPEQQPRVIPVRRRLQGALDDNHHLLLEGGPGSGKSTTAAQLVRELALGWTEGHPGARALSSVPVVPVLITARQLAGHLHLPLPEALAAVVNPSLGARLTERLPPFEPPAEGVAWLIVVDGLDEVPGDELRTLVQVLADWTGSESPHYRFLLTSRPLSGGAAELLGAARVGHYTLVPFDRSMLEEFAVRWFTARKARDPRAEALRFRTELTSSGLLDVAATPLLAGVAIRVFHDQGTLPRNRHDLYEHYLAFVRRENAARREGARRAAVRTDRAVEALYERLDELIEHLALVRVTRRTSLRLAARDRLAAQGVPDPGPPPLDWDTTVAAALQSTGLITSRAGELDFLHLTFAEHLAARIHAAELPATFDPDHPGWDRWIRRAASADPSAGVAVLTRWARDHPAQDLLTWLLEGPVGTALIAVRLVAEGTAAADTEIARCLTVVERRIVDAAHTEPWELVRRFPIDEQVLTWTEMAAEDRSWTEQAQAGLCRLRADLCPAAPERMIGRLEEMLRPGHESEAQAGAVRALLDLVPGRRAEVTAALRGLLADPDSHPGDRIILATALLECGDDHREESLRHLLALVEDPRTGAFTTTLAATSLAEAGSDRRDRIVAVLTARLAAPGTVREDRIQTAEILAGIDPASRNVASSVLRAIVTTETSSVYWNTAVTALTKISAADRLFGIERLVDVAVSPTADWYDRVSALKALCGMGGRADAGVKRTTKELIIQPGLPLRHLASAAKNVAGLDEDGRAGLGGELANLRDTLRPGSVAWRNAVILLAACRREDQGDAALVLTALADDPAEGPDLAQVCALLPLLDRAAADMIGQRMLDWALDPALPVDDRSRLADELWATPARRDVVLSRVLLDLWNARLSVPERSAAFVLRFQADRAFRTGGRWQIQDLALFELFDLRRWMVLRSLLVNPQHREATLGWISRCLRDRRCWSGDWWLLVSWLMTMPGADHRETRAALLATVRERTLGSFERAMAADQFSPGGEDSQRALDIILQAVRDPLLRGSQRVGAAAMAIRRGADRADMLAVLDQIASDPAADVYARCRALEYRSDLSTGRTDDVVSLYLESEDHHDARTMLRTLVTFAPERRDLIEACALTSLRTDRSPADAGALLGRLGRGEGIHAAAIAACQGDASTAVTLADQASLVPVDDAALLAGALHALLARPDLLPVQRLRVQKALLRCGPDARRQVVDNVREGGDPLAAAAVLLLAGSAHNAAAGVLLADVLRDEGETAGRRRKAATDLLDTKASGPREVVVAEGLAELRRPPRDPELCAALLGAVICFDKAHAEEAVSALELMLPRYEVAAEALLEERPGHRVAPDDLIRKIATPGHLRWRAAKALVRGTSLHREALANALEPLMKADPATAVRAAALFGRAVPGDLHRAVAVLRALADDPAVPERHRVRAAVALVDAGARAADDRDRLHRALGDARLPCDLRGFAGRTLAQLPGPQRRATVAALLGLPEAVERLRSAEDLAPWHGPRREAALEAARKLTAGDALRPAHRVRAAAVLTEHGDGDDRTLAATTLGELIDDPRTHPWVRVRAHVGRYLTTRAPDTPDLLTRILRDGSVGERCWAAEALAEIDGPQARHVRDRLRELADAGNDRREGQRLRRAAARIDSGNHAA